MTTSSRASHSLARIFRLATFSALLALAPAAHAMQLGTNFWNLAWHASNDCFNDVKNVTGENPWNPQFLKETSIYSNYRFMDWDYTNNSKRVKWSERRQKADPDQRVAAYEWMIDLCNRQNADMWVCVPHLTVNRDAGNAPSDYALRLSLLIKTGVDMKEVDLTPLHNRISKMTADELVKAGGTQVCEPLKPNLKLYLEYSNETWNGSFKQTHYCIEEGTALNLAPDVTPSDDGKVWANGYKFHAWAALRIFQGANLVFGADSPRLMRVLALQRGSARQAQLQLEIINNPTFNPWGIRPDALSIAPYFGNRIVADDPDAVQKLRTEIAESATGIESVKDVAREANMMLVAYEGGQHLRKSNPHILNRSPVMHELYLQYLNEMSKHFTLFCHYAHVGQANEKGAWGAIEQTGQPLADAPKYRALVEWTKAHSGTTQSTP